MRTRRRITQSKPLIAFRPGLKPSVDAPALVDVPGQQRPRRRARAAAALERGYTHTPRRILLAFAVIAAAFVLLMAWTFAGAPSAPKPYVGSAGV